jgi:hypothetical protein
MVISICHPTGRYSQVPINITGTATQVSTTKNLTNMCSASQPSLSAIVEPILKAKHFFPSSELPPYPLPYEQISLFSGL